MIPEREESTRNLINTPEASLGTDIRKRVRDHARGVEIDTVAGLGVVRDHNQSLGVGLAPERSINTRLSDCTVFCCTTLFYLCMQVVIILLVVAVELLFPNLASSLAEEQQLGTVTVIHIWTEEDSET